MKQFKPIIFSVLIIFLLSNSTQSIISTFKTYKFSISDEYIQKSDFNKLIDSQKWIKTIKYIKEETDPNAIFLLFRNAEFPLYAHRKFISKFNPLLVNTYKSENDKVLYTHLKDLNISYMYVPAYTSAVRSNTKFSSFIGNPHYTKLVSNNAGYRLYKIKDTEDHTTYETSKQIVVETTHTHANISNYTEHHTRLYTSKFDIDTNTTYLIRSLLSGMGNTRIAVYESDINGSEFGSGDVKNKFITKTSSKTLMHDSIYVPSKRAKKVKIVYTPSKGANVKILKTDIYIFQEKETTSTPIDITLTHEEYAYVDRKIKVDPHTEYYIKSDIIGDDLLTLYVQEYDSLRNNIATLYLNRVMCKNTLTQVSTIYVPSKKTSYFKLFYRKKSSLQVKIYNHTIYSINTKKDINVKQ